MSKKNQKMNFDIRARVTAEAEKEAAVARVTALEAELAALKAPAVVAAPVATPPAAPSRLAELRAIKAAGNQFETARFSLEHASEISSALDAERLPPTAA